MLKKKVFVKGINNLSDARYCAGMGVAYLCFELDPENENYIAPEKIVEIKNWLVGVTCGVRIVENLKIDKEQLDQIEPDFILSDTSSISGFMNQYPLILETQDEPNKEEARFYSEIDSSKFAAVSPDSFVENNWTPEDITELIASNHDFGIVLQGGKESRPGFSDYGDLMDILELLEE